ncbi:putative barnase/colicin E5 family endoribonuclease [Helicobacter bilis]|uniref:putative barnase/colicin E5 family endoribonuclease n=1 Tax=Helicobacter bilis TaxID=37372 RepID=UPI0018F82BBB|nr:hypothetical protein [Helicobacter bilis]
MQSVFNNLGTALEANYYDVVSSFIPVGKAAQVTKGGIKLTQSLTKTALQSAGMSAIASPLDYINMQNETAQEGDIQDILKHSAGNALGSAVGVYVGAGIAKGASKAYNSIKDLKNLSTDDLKNIKISKYLDNEEASIHRKLAKFNKSEIDSNYEIFKGLQSDRVISKEMKDPTFMGNFMDKISDYNVLKHLSSKKESQDKLLSALFSNKELAREFAGKLTSEEATIVNKAIHAMGENFTRLSKEYEQQIIDEYAKSGKIKGLNPHTEMQNRHVETKHETSYLNGKIDSNFTYTTQETKDIKVLRNDLIGVLSPYKTQPITNKETGMQGFITTDEINKISSKKAIDKSIANGFSRDEHFKVAQDLKSLFENSKLKESHADNKQREHIKVHRFIQDLSINDKEAQAKITLFEKIEGKNRIYTLELEGLEKPDSLSVSMRNAESAVKAQSVATAHPETTTIAKTDTDIIPQNLPEVYKHMLDEIDKQAKQDYKTSIDNLQNALNDTDFKATLLQGYKQVTDDAIDSLGLDNQLTNTLIRETQKLESKQSVSLSEAIELRKNINEIMRNYEKSSSDLKKFRANKHLDNIKDNIDNAIKSALDSKVAQNEAKLNTNVSNTQALDSVMLSAKHETSLKQNTQGTNTLTRQEADELFSNFQQANKNYAQIKESLNDKFAKALTKGMNKKDLDSRLTIEQWKQRVLDTQWGDSVKGLENTIFKNFNPRMQKHTQMLTILRALDRNVKLNDDSMPIDFTKILSDIENLEKLTLHPEIYPILDTFKSYAKSYQFAQEISKAKALENKLGGGALATTLEGRIKVFLTNRLFKKLFAFIPYVGDNAAITKALQSAIKDLKYPSEITLETLKVLNKADLDKGFKPIKDKEPRFEYKAHTPLSDKELQSQIRGNTQILTPKDTSEIEAIASNPLIQNMERQAKYNEELTQKISQFEANKENIQQDILNNLVVATQEIKQNTELLKQLAQQLTHNNPIHTPNKSIIKAQIDNETYFITTDKNNITAIEKQEIQNLAQPKTYDELMQRDKNEEVLLDSMRNQYVEIAEIKEAQKQLLLEYKPEVAKAETSVKDTQNIQDINFNILSQKNTGEVKKLIVKNLKDQELIGATITSKEGINATLSINSIGKMISDKAIQKSLDNGFSRAEHLKAVLDIRPLFENAIRRESTQDKKGNGLIIHRLESNIDEKSLALITLKESQQHGRKIYTIELQLSPKSTSPSTPLNTKADLGEIPSQETKGGQDAETPIGYSADIIPQKLTERIKNDLDSNDYAEMLKSLKQLENKQAEIDTFTNETNLIRNTLEKQETEKYEKIVSPLFDKYPIMKEFYNERDINTHIYFKRFKNEFLERYNTQYDFFTLDEKAFLAKYPNFTQQDYKEATTQNLKALKDKNVSINEYVSFAKEYMDIVNNPVFEKMAKEIDSVDKKYWDTHFEMSDQRDSKVNEIIAILKKDIDSIDIANKADVSIDNFHKLGRYLAFMKQPEFGFANKLTFTKTGFFGKFLEQTDIKQRELLGELLSVEKLLEKEGKANRVLQDRLFTIFRLMRGEELLDREIKDVPLARELIEKQLNIKPIKEFGTNYAEHYHSGETAIQKLINEAQAHKESGAKGEYKGQVAGAFHRKELGDIDLVWGEVTDFEKHKGYGLAHILDKHPEFDVFNIPKVIEQGKIEKTYNGYNIVTDDYIVGLNKGFKDKDGNIINDSNVWVVTSFEPQVKLKKEASSIASVTSNYIEPMPQKPNPIIPQTKPYEVNENGKKYIEIPDDELADFEKSIKEALLLEPRQQELLKKNQCRF